MLDGRGDIWFTAQMSNHVGKMTRATGEIRLAEMPTPRSLPYGIVIDAGGRPWFNQFGTSKIGTIDPITFEVREYALPFQNARGRRIAVTPDGSVWYADYARGSLGRLDPSNGEVREWQTPGGPSSRPYALTTDARGRLWLVESGVRPNALVGFDPGSETFFDVTPVPSGGGTVRHMIFHAPSSTIWFGTDANTIGRAHVP